jgi:uncharacterized membrane protein YozB (DUF420 family)
MRSVKRTINGLFFFLENLGAGVWVGALLTFGLAVAAPLFRTLPSVTQAGGLVAQVLHRINFIEAGAATVMVIAALVFLAQKEQRTPLRIGKAVLAAVMALTLFYYGVSLMERMEHLRTVEIRDFDQWNEATPAFREEFDDLHKLYTQLAQVNLFLGLGFLLLSAFEKK